MAKEIDAVCSFCGREKDDAEILIAGISGHICDVCVKEADTIVENESDKNVVEKLELELKKPVEIKAHIDDYVIGQEKAKRTLSVAVYNHYKRLLNPPTDDCEVELDKSNVILVGETGTGKTLRPGQRETGASFCMISMPTKKEAGKDAHQIFSFFLHI